MSALQSAKNESSEFFSFHLVRCSFFSALKYFVSPLHKKGIQGLKHSESFFIMNLGESIFSPQRYNFRSFAFFLWWKDEQALDQFLEQPQFSHFKDSGWHVRLKPYRRWGGFQEINEAFLDNNILEPEGPVVGITLAKLKLTQTLRFIKWGKPVEEQVRDHKGSILALAAMRPFHTFCTFSIWKNESEMLTMVRGRSKDSNGEQHRLAMIERARKPFHYEFVTMRCLPIKESGHWKGKSNFVELQSSR